MSLPAEDATSPQEDVGPLPFSDKRGSIASRLRRDSIRRALESDIPVGMWSATATTLARAPTISDLRSERYSQESYGHDPESGFARPVGVRRASEPAAVAEGETVAPEEIKQVTQAEVMADPEKTTDAFTTTQDTNDDDVQNNTLDRTETEDVELQVTRSGTYPTGYKFPPKRSRAQASLIGFKKFCKFCLTPFGFLLVIYGLNIVAWGGMLFLLLIGGGEQYMCFVQKPRGSGHWVKDCNDLYSPRRIWIEIDSQILNALFCVTGFGLIPWRFRDFYFLLKWRIGKDYDALRRLAAWHGSWFRLPAYDQLDPGVKIPDDESMQKSLPLPLTKAPEAPLTGFRAKPTKLWKMDFVVWMFVANTLLQGVLSGFMWGLNRFNRPSWSTGLFIALAAIVAGLAGILQFREGKKIKAKEGIPLDADDIALLQARKDAEKNDV